MSRRSAPNPPSLRPIRWIGWTAAAIGFAIPWFVDFPGLSEPGHRMFSIFMAAVALWITEAIPLHATAAAIILAEILLVSDQALLALPEGFAPPSYAVFFHTLANPVLMLFLGGFFLADAAAKYELDRNLARVLLRPFGTSPAMILLGLMLVTAVFSMFMSNTATTATMMAVVLPVISQLPEGDRMRGGFALCIPVAANIGGIGTPVGTPPNAIALGALFQAGHRIGFLQWMLMTVPFVIAILALAWLVMNSVFRSKEAKLILQMEGAFTTSGKAVIFYLTFTATVLLWLTENLHGMSASIVGFIPVVVLLATGVFTTRDLQHIQWSVLWLVAGGIALGTGVERTGFDHWLIGLIRWETFPPAILAALMALVALAMGTFISHSATANLLVPIGMSLAQSDAVAISPVLAGIFIAVGSSLAMALPVSTPPNAIAMSTGTVRTSDMAKVGLLVGLAGWLLFVFVAPWFWKALGVMPR